MKANKIHKLLGILFVLGVASILLACPGESSSNGDSTGTTSTTDDVSTPTEDKIFARWKESDSYKAITEATIGTAIATVEELKNIQNDLTGTYYLTSNIDISGATWEPLGSTDTPFTGTFNGNGYIVYGLTIEATSTDADQGKYQGLFAIVNDAVVKDVGIGVTSVSAVGIAGALIGEARGTSEIDNVAVARMADTAEITISDVIVGGLVGNIIDTVKVTNAYNLEMVVKSTKTGSSVSSQVGGLVGSVMTNKIHGYTFTGDDDTKTILSGKGLVGGLVGIATGAANIRGYVSGKGEIKGDSFVGGLVGSVGTGSIVRGYFDGGKITQIAGSNIRGIGGLAGRFVQDSGSASVSGYVANATITGIGDVGGLVGWLFTGIVSGYVVDSTITGTGENALDSVGGLVAKTYNSDRTVVSGYILRGSISGENRVGGLVGSVIQNNSLTGTARIGGYVETRVTTTSTDQSLARALVSVSATADITGYWDQSAVGNSNEDRGTAISAIADVVYDSITGAYTDSGNNNTVVFDNANFLTQFSLPGASAQRPTLQPYRVLPYGITLSATTTSTTHTANLLAVAPWDNIDTVTWSSSNTAVVTVAANGVATGQGTGSATITATWKSGDGTVTGTATMSITVP